MLARSVQGITVLGGSVFCDFFECVLNRSVPPPHYKPRKAQRPTSAKARLQSKDSPSQNTPRRPKSAVPRLQSKEEDLCCADRRSKDRESFHGRSHLPARHAVSAEKRQQFFKGAQVQKVRRGCWGHKK